MIVDVTSEGGLGCFPVAVCSASSSSVVLLASACCVRALVLVMQD